MVDLKFFESIGFQLSTNEEVEALIDMAIQRGVKPSSPRGLYAYWPLGNGAEVWVALDKSRNVVNLDAHFVGSSRVPVRLEELHDLAENLAGGFKVWTNPNATEEEATTFPMMVTVPDWDFVHAGIEKRTQQPQDSYIFELQLTAFAREVKCFVSQEEYYASQAQEAGDSQPKIAAVSFFPTGLFVEPGTMPGPWAVFGGTILDGRVLVNPVTQAKSWYLSVETLNMTVDVVADASTITGRPQKGGFISGSFCLSGRPLFDIQDLQKWMSGQAVH